MEVSSIILRILSIGVRNSIDANEKMSFVYATLSLRVDFVSFQ